MANFKIITHYVSYWKEMENLDYDLECFYGNENECKKFIDDIIESVNEYNITSVELADTTPQEF